MPKRVSGWECSVCHTFYDEEAGAKDCESRHPLISDVVISSFSFDNLNNKYGEERAIARHTPVKIVLRLSPQLRDIAEYALVQYGFRGV